MAMQGIVKAAIKAARIIPGSLTFVGNIVKNIGKTVPGSLTFTGNISESHDFGTEKSSDGELSFTGTLSRVIIAARTLAGSLSPSGVVSYGAYERTKDGGLSFTGALTRVVQYSRTVSGSITPSGSIPATWIDVLYYGVQNP